MGGIGGVSMCGIFRRGGRVVAAAFFVVSVAGVAAGCVAAGAGVMFGCCGAGCWTIVVVAGRALERRIMRMRGCIRI